MLCLYTHIKTPPADAKVARRAEPSVAYPELQSQNSNFRI